MPKIIHKKTRLFQLNLLLFVLNFLVSVLTLYITVPKKLHYYNPEHHFIMKSLCIICNSIHTTFITGVSSEPKHEFGAHIYLKIHQLTSTFGWIDIQKKKKDSEPKTVCDEDSEKTDMFSIGESHHLSLPMI